MWCYRCTRKFLKFLLFIADAHLKTLCTEMKQYTLGWTGISPLRAFHQFQPHHDTGFEEEVKEPALSVSTWGNAALWEEGGSRCQPGLCCKCFMCQSIRLILTQVCEGGASVIPTSQTGKLRPRGSDSRSRREWAAEAGFKPWHLVQTQASQPPHGSVSLFLKWIFTDHGCFTALCLFLMYPKVNQLHVHTHPLFTILLPFRPPESIKESSLCYTVGSC